MDQSLRSVFAATGSYIPEIKIHNRHFLQHRFLEKDGSVATPSRIKMLLILGFSRQKMLLTVQE